jgi:hypothetical protein
MRVKGRAAREDSLGKDGTDAAALTLWFPWAEPHFEDLHYLDWWDLGRVLGRGPGLRVIKS